MIVKARFGGAGDDDGLAGMGLPQILERHMAQGDSTDKIRRAKKRNESSAFLPGFED